MATIDVNEGARAVEAADGERLFDALTRAGIFLPNFCEASGACGWCRVRATGGAGEPTAAERSLLTADELAAGTRLACQVRVGEGLRIQVPKKLLAMKHYRGVVSRLAPLAANIKELGVRLVQPATVDYRTGQFMQIRSHPVGEPPQILHRAYSLASPEDQKSELEFVVQRVPNGACSGWIHDRLKVGDEVILSGPHGEFYLRETDAPVLMVAGGSGLAPFKGMLARLARDRSDRPVTLFFGANTPAELFYLEAMREFEQTLPRFQFVPAVRCVDQNEAWRGESGTVVEALARHVADASNLEAYLCGSPGMIKACVELLTSRGLTKDRLYYDRFA